ncbi:MAG: KUP/HAK/KT family potassium transporter [Bacteroidetes bacterium]|jgi:KUP system potassium uptake protein|nr:KUP/HAK/KT family potassium transporter [Bacteroidota bacterium]
MSHSHINKVTGAGLLITLGIIFGDIGTSPLYVMSAIMGDNVITQELVYGGLSAVFWTLTIQTTIKYIILVLRADNKGEGGIFSLYNLLKRRYPQLIVGTVIGGAMLLADGIITPPLSVSSAIEGLRLIDGLEDLNTVPIVITILIGLFMIQRAGTSFVGKSFGPIMLIWFSMLTVLGVLGIAQHPEILKALSPTYALSLLIYSKYDFFLILGAVFLCTTGAEALYSDMGHCGRKNIRVSWTFVKLALVVNYFGQGAWLLGQEGQTLGEQRPFYALMPDWFLPVGIGIAAMATIIASQALITGAFTLVSEAIRLHFFPKFTVKYPSDIKGQIYIPVINSFLLMGCITVVLLFQEAEKMEAAYGLAITIDMLMTSILLAYFMKFKRYKKTFVYPIMALFFFIESVFLIANLSKFSEGGFFTVLIGAAYIVIMYSSLRGGKIKNDVIEKEDLHNFRDKLRALSRDTTLPKYATHLVYMSKVKEQSMVESPILYSILHKRPKRADFYWFVNIEVTDEPYTMEYKVNTIEKNDIYKVQFRLGFRVQQKISIYLKTVIREMVESKEIDLDPHYHAFIDKKSIGDFRYVLVEEEMSQENDLPLFEHTIMKVYNAVRYFSGKPEKWFGLDGSMVSTELVPLIVAPRANAQLKRIK